MHKPQPEFNNLSRKLNVILSKDQDSRVVLKSRIILYFNISSFRSRSLLVMILKESFFPSKVIDILPSELWCQHNFCLVSLVNISL